MERGRLYRVGTVADQQAMAVARGTAQEYRRLAQECRAMARSVSTEEARAALLDMAQVWLRLAEEREAAIPPGETPIPPAGVEGAQPAAQQQQQIQPKGEGETE